MYRRYPAWGRGLFLKKRAGYERRWDLEEKGFTKKNCFRILHARLLRKLPPGRFLELAAGDGLVGSLGVWLEEKKGWKVEAWEHRPIPQRFIRQYRPKTQLHIGRLTDWSSKETATLPVGITTRAAREAAGVCRAIRQGLIRPSFLGIWNPSGRPAWFHRLRREGYRLEAVWHRTEFYRRPFP